MAEFFYLWNFLTNFGFEKRFYCAYLSRPDICEEEYSLEDVVLMLTPSPPEGSIIMLRRT